jgi:integrase
MIHFGEDTYRLLHEWKLSFPGAKSKHYVFPSQRYGLIGEHQMRGGTLGVYKTFPDRPTASLHTAWYSAQKAAGVQCRWHDLRHTCTSLLSDQGATTATLMSMLGWMSPRMIERYSHAATKAKQAAVAGAGAVVREMLEKMDEKVTVQ